MANEFAERAIDNGSCRTQKGSNHMLTSDTINEIAAALAKAQGDIANPAKEAENPHFRSRYADLAAGLNAVKSALSANAIAVVQSTYMADDLLMLNTRLVHASGQWFSSDYPVCRFPAKHQEAGSALTYSRRYALFALVGIAGDDDDGNEASKSETPAPKRKAAPPPPPVNHQLPTEAEVMDLMRQGDEKVREGVVALQNWWKALSGAERYALGERQKNDWKLEAERLEQGVAA